MNRWFPSGYGFRRWAVVFALGVAILALGMAMGITNFYRAYVVDSSGTTVLYFATLQFIGHPWRELLVGIVGLGLLVWGGLGISRASQRAAELGKPIAVPILAPMIAPRKPDGPRMVAIGGGTGMPTLLRGLKEVTDNITAVVNVVDDGGSSGRLRRDLGITPPGDFRNNLVALSDVEPLMTELFQHRFEGAGELEGHSFGNLFLVAMTGVTGNFEQAIRESSRVLAVRGKVLPASLEDIELYAELRNGDIVRGESVIPRTAVPLKRVFMHPAHASAYPEALAEIHSAEIIILGPGSLFTSIMPPLLVEDIARAVKNNPTAIKVYICNVATQPGETDDFDVAKHVQALHDHIGHKLFDYVIYNSNMAYVDMIQPEWNVKAVTLDPESKKKFPGIEFIPADVVRDENPLRHDPAKLADAVMALYYKRGGKTAAPGNVRDRERRNGTDEGSAVEDRRHVTQML